MKAAEPKRYVVQKHIMATCVQEALDKEAKTPVHSVFPDSNQSEGNVVDAIGFKSIPEPE